MWSVGWRSGDVKGLYHVSIFDNYAALWKCLMLIKPAFLIKNTENCNIVKYYYNLKDCISILMYFKISFISVMQSCIFSIITPVFSVTWSFRNHSDMMIYYQYWKQLCCFYIFILLFIFRTCDAFWGLLIDKNEKEVRTEQYLAEIQLL